MRKIILITEHETRKYNQGLRDAFSTMDYSFEMTALSNVNTDGQGTYFEEKQQIACALIDCEKNSLSKLNSGELRGEFARIARHFPAGTPVIAFGKDSRKLTNACRDSDIRHIPSYNRPEQAASFTHLFTREDFN